MKSMLRLFAIFALAFTALACGSEKTGCNSNADCGGGTSFCNTSGTCSTSPGTGIVFDDEEPGEEAAEAEANPEAEEELE